MSRLSVSLNFSHFAVWTMVGKGCAVWGLFRLSISELESGTDISYLPVAQNVKIVPRSCAWNGFYIKQS